MRSFSSSRLAAVVGAVVVIVLLAASASASAAVEGSPFGIAKFSMETTGPTREIPVGGPFYEFANEPEVFTQAGGHPWALTTKVEFASEEIEHQNGSTTEKLIVPTRDPKDLVVDLPPGLLGDPLATPRCPLELIQEGDHRCPSSTQVGVYRLHWFGGKEFLGPIINVVPEAGQSAEFALENEIHINQILIAHLVRTPEGYAFTVTTNDIPQIELLSAETTFWGVPADPSHNAMRGLYCATTARDEAPGLPLRCQPDGGQPAGVAPVPFLTMPTDCSAGPLPGSVRADSWEQPGKAEDNQRYAGYAEADAEQALPTLLGGASQGISGCNLLGFAPTVETHARHHARRRTGRFGCEHKSTAE